MNAGLTAVSWLDWKLGARLLLKYPALSIIGGLSLAGAIAIGAVGIEVADELLYKRLPFDEGGRVVRLETQDTAASRVEPRVLHDFAIWRRSLKTVTELGAARVSERNVLTGEGRVEALRVADDHLRFAHRRAREDQRRDVRRDRPQQQQDDGVDRQIFQPQRIARRAPGECANPRPQLRVGCRLVGGQACRNDVELRRGVPPACTISEPAEHLDGRTFARRGLVDGQRHP